VIVGSWPCKVSSEIHINGRHVSELVHEGKGKMMATEPKDEKDSKRACVVLSKGNEVVGLGYSRLTGAAAKVMDMGENSGNPNRVSWVSRDNSTDRQADRVSQDNNNSMDWQADWVGRVNQNFSTDRRANRVSRVNRVSWVGSTEQKTGGSSQVANTESQVMENLTNMESWVTENLANTESQVTQNSANTKSRVMENSANTKNRFMQDSGGGVGN
jgi:hypothetical protein